MAKLNITENHFWYTGRKEIILDTLRKNIPDLHNRRLFEVGCGSGIVMKYLKDNGIMVSGCDIDKKSVIKCKQKTKAPVYNYDALGLPYFCELGIVGMFDVLEHINDDSEAINVARVALKKNGYLILTVPTAPFLWSNFDSKAGHFRRYTKHDILRLLDVNGFKIIKVSHFMFFLYPLLAVLRITNKGIETKTVPVINQLFLMILRLEKYLIRNFSLPFGSSLIVVARKR